jgi:hypothetical protein
MRDIHARAEVLGEIHGAHAVLRLGEGRLGRRPVLQGVAALRLHLPADAVYELDVLGVADDRRSADARRFLQQVVEIAVVGSVEAQIAAFFALEVHEVLERGHAVILHVGLELLDMPLVRSREMEGVINVRTRAGVAVLALEDLGVGLVVEEIAHHGGEAADGRMARLGGVLRDLFARQAEVHMRIDEPGEDMQSLCRVLGYAARNAFAGREQTGNAAVLHVQVERLGCPVGEHYRAAAQNEFGRHFSLLSR